MFGRLLVELYVLFFSVVIDQVSEDELNNNTERVNVSIYKNANRTHNEHFLFILFLFCNVPFTHTLGAVQLDARKGCTNATKK